jgi:hypothetical protein
VLKSSSAFNATVGYLTAMAQQDINVITAILHTGKKQSVKNTDRCTMGAIGKSVLLFISSLQIKVRTASLLQAKLLFITFPTILSPLLFLKQNGRDRFLTELFVFLMSFIIIFIY